MYLIYLWSNSIEKEQTARLIKSVTVDNVKKFIETWDFFEDHELILNVSDKSHSNSCKYDDYRDKTFKKLLSTYVTERYYKLVNRSINTDSHYNEVHSFEDNDGVEYNIGIEKYEVLQ